MKLHVGDLLPGDLVADLPQSPIIFVLDKRISSFSVCICIQLFDFQTKKIKWVDYHLSHEGTILGRSNDE